MAKKVFFIFTITFLHVMAEEDATLQNLTRVDHASNIYIGAKHIQRIDHFYINEENLSCTERYLPIMFTMLNENKNKINVNGYLKEDGRLIAKQENSSNCKIIKK